MTTPTFRVIDHSPGAAVPDDEHRFLDELEVATVIRVPGKRDRPGRVVAGLLHGNEPSGLRAIHRYLRQLRADSPPATNTCFFLGAVEAARLPPRASRRRLPEGRDLNRCFVAPFDALGREGVIAEAALAVLRAAAPEAVLDLHNNSGRNPAYGVVTDLDEARLGLTALFAPRVVRSHLRLATFTEAWEGVAPAVTIECGQAGTAEADATALAGLLRFLELPGLPPDPRRQGETMEVFVSPVQVRLRSGLGLAFAARAVDGVEVTLDAELDRHNFQTVPAQSPLGFVSAEVSAGLWPFAAQDESGRECSHDYLEIVGGVVRAARSFVPMMATCNARIAADDCLFYVTQRA